MRDDRPLCVDLDGTLIRGDMLRDAVWLLGRKYPVALVRLAGDLLRGRAAFKRAVARTAAVPAHTLEYHLKLLARLESERRLGRRIVLATGSDEADAFRVAEHLGVFDTVIASNGSINVTGHNKARILSDMFGADDFDYVGDSVTDLPVWARAHAAWVVSDSAALVARVRQVAKVDLVLGWRVSLQ